MVMKLLKLHDFIRCFWQLWKSIVTIIFLSFFPPQIKTLEAPLTHDLDV